jgi:hypothetical protein
METAVATIQPQIEGLSVKQVTDRVNIVHKILEKVMKKGTHYGTVPGCGSKMVLFKPGADVLAMTFQLVPKFDVATENLANGHKEYTVTCTMFNASGVMLGQGVGSGSTMEKKYRYRKEASGIKIENEDIADVYNTVLKMAKKRAHIDATLTVTGSADLFTQDLIDEDAPPKDPVTMPTPQADQPPPEQSPDLTNVTGIVELAGIKGNRYYARINGEFYNTFDKNIGEALKTAKGKQATIGFVTNEKGFHDIVIFTPSKAAGQETAEAPSTAPCNEQGELL